jgi:glutaconyl-CoA/methylmalonyl-CoA decarboxylase subunit gamma
MARVSDPSVTVTPLAPGTYRVEHEGRNEIVYVAGSVADRWIFWEGQVFRGERGGPDGVAGRKSADVAGPDKVRPSHKLQPTSLTAPMPARVIRILVQPGAAVKKGDTLVMLEAMKMELPIRAPADGKVAAIHCRDGELVQADAVLIDLE